MTMASSASGRKDLATFLGTEIHPDALSQSSPNKATPLAASGRKDLASLLGSEFLNENICHPCYCDGQQLPAVGFCVTCQESLCVECYRYHTIPSLTRNHELVQKQTSLKNTLRNTWRKTSILHHKNKIQEKCEEHMEKTIKYYCPDHDFLGCSICVTLKHRLCENMVHIPDVSKEVLDSDEFKFFENKLELVAKSFDGLSSEVKEKVTLVDTINATAVEAVDQFRSQIDEVLNDLERDMKSQLKQIREDENKDLTDISRRLNETVTEIKLISHQFKLLTANGEKNYGNIYIAMKRAMTRLKALQGESKNVETDLKKTKGVKNYMFVPATDILEHIRSCIELGNIDFKETKMEKEADIKVHTDTDTMACWISGSTILPDDRIIAADRNNKKLKMVDTLGKVVTSEIQLPARPWDVTKVTDTQVVVSLPNRKRLSFISTEPALKLERDISVQEPCYGLVYNNDMLVVSNAANHKVQILDMEGVVLKSFYRTENGLQMFHTPSYVALSPDCLLMYVSCSGNNAVTSVSLDGRIVASYTDEDVKLLRQVVADETGMVYVCGAQNNIHQITGDCRKVKALLTEQDEEFQPFSICYDSVTKKLYIGMENVDVIKVFTIMHATPTTEL